MTIREKKARVWLLISVKRGFIEEPEIYNDESSANRRKEVLMRDFNPDYDEIGIWEKLIRV